MFQVQHKNETQKIQSTNTFTLCTTLKKNKRKQQLNDICSTSQIVISLYRSIDPNNRSS